MSSAARPVSWVSFVLYGAVLVAGLYAALAGLGRTRPVLFVGGLAALVAVDLVERRRYPVRTPPWPAAALLVARLAFLLNVVAADGSGLSQVLFVLLPFTAYFAFGLAASIALGVACLGVVVAGYAATTGHWYRDVEHLTDLLMFGLGLVLTIAIASYADRVAVLSATTERNRLARDIHDGLGHHLTAIAVLLEKAAAFRGRDPAAADRAVADAHRSARRALDDVRLSVRALRDETVPFRLSAALDDLVREIDGLPIALDIAGDETGYDPAALTALYRAAQEGITNARRHAHATRVSVSVRLDGSGARLLVADDGRGFPPDREGFGLAGMRERIRLAGGSVDVDSEPDAGTRIAVAIPRRRAP